MLHTTNSTKAVSLITTMPGHMAPYCGAHGDRITFIHVCAFAFQLGLEYRVNFHTFPFQIFASKKSNFSLFNSLFDQI